MTLLLWEYPEDNPIIECWGNRYRIQYYRINWENIFINRWKKNER